MLKTPVSTLAAVMTGAVSIFVLAACLVMPALWSASNSKNGTTATIVRRSGICGSFGKQGQANCAPGMLSKGTKVAIQELDQHRDGGATVISVKIRVLE
jgi:hypothetical protein